MRLYNRSGHILSVPGTVVLALLLIAPLVLCGQENLGKGRIMGQVQDEKGAPLEGVKITAQSQSSAAVLEGVTDKKGHFAVAGLGTGRWKVKATLPGYAPGELEMSVTQLTRNPPITFTMKKVSGLTALMSDEESFKLFDRGNALFNEGKLDEAQKVFEEFLVKYPEIYQVHLNIGSCHLKREEWDKAESEFQLVLDKTRAAFMGDLRQDPAASIRALSGLGEIALKKQDLAKASEYFKQAVDISPQDEVAAYNVAEIFFSNQNIEGAIHYFEVASQIKKDWPKPHLKLGYAYLNKGDYARAIESFNRFIELDPENPEVPQVRNIIATIEKLKK